MESLVAAIPAIALLFWLVACGDAQVANKLMLHNREIIYRSTATVSGTLLGFTIATASVVLGFFSSKRLRVLRESDKSKDLWRTFFQAAKFLGILTVVSLASLAVDTESSSNVWVLVPFVLFAGLSFARVVRVIWILEQIFLIVSKPTPSSR